MVSFTLRLLYSTEMKSVIHWIGARMGPTVGLDAVAKIEILDFDFKKNIIRRVPVIDLDAYAFFRLTFSFCEFLFEL
jgi:hypothetical protein